MNAIAKRKPPELVDGVRVHVSGNPIVAGPDVWVMLVPYDEYDGRRWAFSLESGKVMLTT